MRLPAWAKHAGKAVVGDAGVERLQILADPLVIWGRTQGTSDGRRSASALSHYRNKFRGERAVIIGNGPSLRDTDLSLLAAEHTFGLNRVYLLFDEIGFETTFLVTINELVISQTVSDLSAVTCPTFVRWSCRDMFDRSARQMTFLQSRHAPGFSTNVRNGVWEGATVTYVAMQLAFHMGFTTVVLVGVDHSFSMQGPAHQVVESGGDDPNHFHPKYFGKGFRWQLPDLQTSEYAYRLARAAYAADGRRIIDATVGGRLDVFEKADLRAVLTS
jgi:hypothetical protein